MEQNKIVDFSVLDSTRSELRESNDVKAAWLHADSCVTQNFSQNVFSLSQLAGELGEFYPNFASFGNWYVDARVQKMSKMCHCEK